MNKPRNTARVGGNLEKDEISRLQSLIVDGERALSNEQQRSKNKLKQLTKDKDHLESTVQDKDRAAEKEKEISGRALPGMTLYPKKAGRKHVRSHYCL